MKTTGATAVALAAAGCLGGTFSNSSSDEVVLDEPDGYNQLRSHRDDGAIPHPIHGDELPDVSAPCAIQGEEIRTSDFVGDRHTLYTFIFTRCPSACLTLTSNLVQVQVDAIQNRYSDEVALLPITFDPEYDTSDVVLEYSDDRGAAVAENNWYFLRPTTEQRAEEVVQDTFGIHYARLSDAEREEMDMPDSMAFRHDEAIILANADGYVERTYFGDRVPGPGELVDDIETLRERW